MHSFRAAAQSASIFQIREVLAPDVTFVDSGGQPDGDEPAALRQRGRADRAARVPSGRPSAQLAAAAASLVSTAACRSSGCWWPSRA